MFATADLFFTKSFIMKKLIISDFQQDNFESTLEFLNKSTQEEGQAETKIVPPHLFWNFVVIKEGYCYMPGNAKMTITEARVEWIFVKGPSKGFILVMN